MTNRKILIPMWMAGDKLYSFRTYQNNKREAHFTAGPMKRVWVGLDRHHLFADQLQASDLKDWIFCCMSAGHRQVKQHNAQQLTGSSSID